MMTRLTISVAGVLLLGLFVSGGWRQGGDALFAQAGQHAYFDGMVQRGDHWKSYSLRPRPGAPITSPHYEHQLATPRGGGYAQSNARGLFVTYDPARDTHVAKQDAAKAVVPEYSEHASSTVAVAVGPTDTNITVNANESTISSHYSVKGRHLRIGNEVVQLDEHTPRTGNVIHVRRGVRGTMPQAHPVGTGVHSSNNNLQNQVRLPLGTSDGNRYFFVWDSYWTDTYMQSRSAVDHYKAFQFQSDAIWLEPRLRFDGGWGVSKPAEYDSRVHVATIDFRAYNRLGGSGDWSATDGNTLGPGVTGREPLSPVAGTFTVLPNTWLRHFVMLEQNANDYDYVSAWVADETRGPVQVLSRLPVSVRVDRRSGTSTVTHFWLELNTSRPSIADREIGLDLVSYHRNFVALVNPPADVSALLIRPGASTPVPVQLGPGTQPGRSTLSPRPPGNVRVAP